MLVCFLLLQPYAEWEAAYLASALTGFGHQVRTASLRRAPVRSMGGFTLLPDCGLEDIPDRPEGLILVGGQSWRSGGAKLVEPLVRRAFDRGAVVAAICDAAGFLGTIGLLNQRRHTCNDLADLKRWAGERYMGETLVLPRQAVRDGTLVTANGTAALEFALETLLALDAAPEGDIRAWYQFHKLGAVPPPGP